MPNEFDTEELFEESVKKYSLGHNIVTNDPEIEDEPWSDYDDDDDYDGEFVWNEPVRKEIPDKVWVALEVIKTQHQNQVTNVALDVIYKYLKED